MPASTRSVTAASYGVVPWLISTTRAPACSARPTNEAAGSTTSEEPSTSSRSHARAWCAASANSCAGSGSPKFTTDEMSRPPPPRVPPHRLSRILAVAAEATQKLSVAVQFRQARRVAARAAMEVIRVLRDQELQLVQPLERDEGQVGGVGLDLTNRDAPRWRGQACVAPRPDPIRAPKIGDAGVGTDAGAGEGDYVRGLEDPVRDGLDGLLKAQFGGHAVRPDVTDGSGEHMPAGQPGSRLVIVLSLCYHTPRDTLVG